METDKNTMMGQPFPKSFSFKEKHKRLLEIIHSEDTVAILIDADPDSMASALTLKRLFWRKVKKTLIYRINAVKRTDNLAFIKLLKVDLKHIRDLNPMEITKWALVDSQPHHNEQLSKYSYDIVIDHHPLNHETVARFMDIKEEYGANATIMTEYLKAARIKPSSPLATALFYGIKTDTDNFVRSCSPHDINAFRYLYPIANLNIIKKIESSEITKGTLNSFRIALDNLTLFKDRVFIHMGKISTPDILVIMADFFLKMTEVKWSIVSGIYGQKLIIIFRYAGFRLNAGKEAQRLFAEWGFAGGHKSAARAEIPVHEIEKANGEGLDIEEFVLKRIKKKL
ncbi:MAG: DHH family phosphoesterase [Deltaproteobacteria bacterium]|nr:DHH family phosphoesterase [Deltaproteobacteria bacterium]MBW2205756.1 DHH family phosphoesterase [Deltaproteobacteria bacterium]